MPSITLSTTIHAPIDICFDLSCSIDLHMLSTAGTGEKAIAGRTSGLVELNDTVTWRAKHLGVWQNLTSRISEFNRPCFFVDEMISGAFKSFRHEHHFEEQGKDTVMKDIFTFEAPLGILGVIANKVFLTRYMTRFLQERNKMIKDFAQTEKGKELLQRYYINPTTSSS